MENRASILIVEDESIVALELRERLNSLGYHVADTVSTGEDAVRQASRRHPDLVLMDIRLRGEMDGIEAADEIQRRLDTPVIFLTAYADDETLQRAKIKVPYGYILKPFEGRDLHVTIEMALSQHAMEKRLKNRERWLTTTLRSIGEAVIAADINGRVTFVNPVAEKLTGWKKEDALGKNITAIFKVTNNGKGGPEENPITMTLRDGAVIARDNDTELISRDGTRRPISNSVAPIRDDRGNITGAVLIFSDITERKYTAEEMTLRLKRIQRHQAAIVKLATHPAVVSGDFRQAVEQITETVAEAMQVERVSVWLLNEEKKTLLCEDLFQRTSRKHTAGTVLSSEEYPQYFHEMQAARTVDADNARTDPRTREFTETYLIPNNITSMLDAAVRVSGDLAGVVCHEHIEEPRRWTTEEIAFAGEVADQVAQAIQNSQRKKSEEALRESYEKVKDLLEQTVNVLASTVEMRDPYTAGHQRRVAVLACAIAREMDLPGDQIEGLRMAALIHDIGKIYVPAEILSKPGTLTVTERRLIQTHPLVGYNVLKRVEFPWPVASIVLQHHERWDGTGFPEHLSGEAILIESRILGVADVVEAMSSHRPYRAARGITEALKMISENEGTLFDPRVVKACLSLFYRKGFKFDETAK